MNLLQKCGLLSLSLFAFTAVPVQAQTDNGAGPAATADANANAGTITISGITGTITLVNPETGETIQATEGQVVTAPYTIASGEGSKAVLTFSNGTTAELQPGTTLIVNHFTQEPGANGTSQLSLNVTKGEVSVKSPSLGDGSNCVVSTPTSTTSLNGATAVISYDPATADSRIANVSGNVVYTKEGGEQVAVGEGTALNVKGAIDPNTGAASAAGEPEVSPITEADRNAGNIPSPGGNTGNNTTGNNTPPVTPDQDAADSIDPSSTTPGQTPPPLIP